MTNIINHLILFIFRQNRLTANKFVDLVWQYLLNNFELQYGQLLKDNMAKKRFLVQFVKLLWSGEFLEDITKPCIVFKIRCLANFAKRLSNIDTVWIAIRDKVIQRNEKSWSILSANKNVISKIFREWF